MRLTTQLRRALPALVFAATLLPMPGARAATAYDVHFVPTVGGALIRVEIQRETNFDAAKQPVILTYSPYNTLNEAGDGKTANDGIADRYNPKGIARASADVLGTRGSTGCWDYGGLKEQQSGVDVVKFLAGKIPDENGKFLEWSNGNVAMEGVSYEGTTANMVAATGIPELKAIVPIAAISRWYGYAFKDGVRYFLNSRALADEGFDTPLAFDFGIGRTTPTDPNTPHFQEAVAARAAECGAVEHTMQGYSRQPDYGQFWLERDYRKDAAKFRAATLVVHGWQDYNVKQEEGLDLYEAIPVDDPETIDVVEGVPFKKLVMSQGTHTGMPGQFANLKDRLYDWALKGIDNGVQSEAPVNTLGRTSSGADAAGYRVESAWPPPTTSDLALHLGRSFDCIGGGVPCAGVAGSTGENGTLELQAQNDGAGWTHVDDGTVSEEFTLRDPTNRGTTGPNNQPVRGHGYYSLYHESPPLTQDVRLAGSARLDAWVNWSVPGQHLTPILVEVLSNGNLNLVERGFLNLCYRNGLAQADCGGTGYRHAVVEFLPQDYTFKAGNRIGLILQSSNTVWAVPGAAGTMAYANGPVANVTPVGTRLLLPLVNQPADPSTLFPKP